MTCSNCRKKPVWEFTNQTQLCKSCFKDYFERKILRTIREFKILPKDMIFKIDKGHSLNTKVLKFVLEMKFAVKTSFRPNISSDNLSKVAEDIFLNILKGNFLGFKFSYDKPLCFLSDDEVELYAEINNINGKKRIKNKKICELLKRFSVKNPDIEHNIINSFFQLYSHKNSLK